MKKATGRISLAIGTLLAVALLAACGGGNGGASDAFTLESDVGIQIGDTWYPPHSDVAPLLEALGTDYETFADPSCLYEGEDKEFRYSGISILTNPNGDMDVWYSLEITTDEYPTARGIKVGDTRDALIEAYGDGYYMESDYQMVYSVSGEKGDLASPCIIFDITDDKVSKIAIYYATNV